MGINLSEIQQKQDRLLANIAEQNRKAYEMFYSPTPLNVSLPQYDDLGNLVTVTIPNRANIKKQMWDDVGAAIGQMNRVFYVDAVNGNDLNDGSSTAPFATLNKAVDSIIVGGRGTINLLSDITVSTNMSTKKKDIYIVGAKSDGTKSIITFNTYVRGGYNTLASFYMADGCNIGFRNCTINFDLTGIDPNLPFDSLAEVVSYATEAASLTSIRLSLCDVNLPDNSAYALVHSNGAGSMITLSIHNTTVNSAGVNSFLAKVLNGSLIYNSYSVTLSGAKTAHADIISGVIRDANGLPRNVLSNIII